ncbi:MAG: ketopantoate reductase C-terminal domain-containing protein [Chloroflexota bacterium]
MLNRTLSSQFVPAFGSLEQAIQDQPNYDLIILGMKSYDLESAVQSLTSTGSRLPTLMTTQNGIGVEEIVECHAEGAGVIAGAVTIPVRRAAGNQLIVEKQGRGMGLSTVGENIPVEPYAALMQRAGIEVVAVSDYRSMKWSKALLNTMSNATSAILDMTPQELYQVPSIVDLETHMLRETLAVIDQQQLEIIDLPGAPARWLARGIRIGPYLLMRAILRRGVAGSRGEKMPSFHMDLYSGRKRSEVVFHNGAIADAGESLGVPVPVNRALNDTLMRLVTGEADPSWYAHQPARLLAEVHS